jgi:ribosomal protein S18 acetylase RimI-like enzyme
MWGTVAPSDEEYQEFLVEYVRAPDFDPTLWRVAWDGEEVAGLVLCALRDGVGEVAQVAVRRSWRRRGIARALLLRGLGALRRHDARQIRLYTDAENGQGAKILHESAGFVTLNEHRLYRKPLC